MNKLTIKKIDKNMYKVLLEVPLEDKWYDDVYINCFNENNSYWFKLEHKDNDDGIILEINDKKLIAFEYDFGIYLKKNNSITSCYFTNNNFTSGTKEIIKSYSRNGKVKNKILDNIDHHLYVCSVEAERKGR